MKNINAQIIKYIYALIKINKQDINKCNILITFNKNLSSAELEKKVLKSCEIFRSYTKNNKKYNLQNIFMAFNYKIINNLSCKTLKKYTMLGNYDIGVKVNLKNNQIYINCCAGNGFSLSSQKKKELMFAIKEFDNLKVEYIVDFFNSETRKEEIIPLNKEEIKTKLKQIKTIEKKLKPFTNNTRKYYRNKHTN